jgi:hypothetical protein
LALALTERERAFGAALGPLGMVVFGALHVSVAWTAIGAVLALAMGICAIDRRRVGCAVLAFLTGIGPWWDGFIIFGAVYVVFGFLLVRAGRAGAAREN